VKAKAILGSEARRVSELVRLIPGVLLCLFECRLLHQVPEIEKYIIEPVKELSDVI
jgi:hypothetical protein